MLILSPSLDEALDDQKVDSSLRTVVILPATTLPVLACNYDISTWYIWARPGTKLETDSAWALASLWMEFFSSTDVALKDARSMIAYLRHT